VRPVPIYSIVACCGRVRVWKVPVHDNLSVVGVCARPLVGGSEQSRVLSSWTQCYRLTRIPKEARIDVQPCVSNTDDLVLPLEVVTVPYWRGQPVDALYCL